jgi:hypothetical protein
MREWQIAELLSATTESWVFPVAKDESEPIGRDTLNKWWQRFAREAGVPKAQGYGWHSFRRGFANRLHRSGVTLKEPAGPGRLVDLGNARRRLSAGRRGQATPSPRPGRFRLNWHTELAHNECRAETRSPATRGKSLRGNGRGGIRTHGTLLTYTSFPGVLVRAKIPTWCPSS